jgi:hypothetical protein
MNEVEQLTSFLILNEAVKKGLTSGVRTIILLLGVVNIFHLH